MSKWKILFILLTIVGLALTYYNMKHTSRESACSGQSLPTDFAALLNLIYFNQVMILIYIIIPRDIGVYIARRQGRRHIPVDIRLCWNALRIYFDTGNVNPGINPPAPPPPRGL